MKTAIFATGHEYHSKFKLGDHQYCKFFRDNGFKVLWICPANNHLFYLQDKEKFYDRKKYHKKSPVEVDSGIFQYSPYTLLPYGKKMFFESYFVGKNSLHFCVPRISHYLKNTEFNNPDVLWISNPKYAFLGDYVEYKCLIHRMGDDFKEFKELPDSIGAIEDELIKKADIFYVTAQNLYKKYESLNPEIKYLPNGAEFKHFETAKYILPKEYETYKEKKKILYIGAISTWFDVELLRYSVEQNIECEFFIIGPSSINLDGLKEYKNVHILGAMDYSKIPSYIKYADIGIIPFLLNDLTHSVNPIKMFEYSALGLPTVTVNMDEIDFLLKGKDVPVFVAKDKQQFSDFIREVNRTEEISEKLIAFAKENTWEIRGKSIIEDYKNFLEKR